MSSWMVRIQDGVSLDESTSTIIGPSDSSSKGPDTLVNCGAPLELCPDLDVFWKVFLVVALELLKEVVLSDPR